MRYSSRYVSTAPKKSAGRVKYVPKPGRRSSSNALPIVLLVVSAVVLIGAVAGGVVLLTSGGGGKKGTDTPVVNASDKIHSSVKIDGIDVGGMTAEGARAALASEQKERADKVGVTITDGSSTIKYGANDVKVSFDTDAVLNDARKLKSAGSLKTTLSVDFAALEQQVREYAASISRPPTNAMVLKFDRTKPAGQEFTCSADVPGLMVDADALWAAVKKELDSGAYGTVQASAVPVQASATKDWIEKNMRLIRSFSTKMYDHSGARLTNIMLAAAAVSGRIILPGEEFSVNDATGPRTAAQGYKKAHVINAGVEDNGMAGGVCQVSGTLFNAAVRAGLTIVTRTPHTSKSQYLTLGQDATVDYGHKDLVLKNNTDKPMYIYMTVDTASPWQVTAEIYGEPLPDGESIELDSASELTVLPSLDTWRAEDSEAVDPGEYKIEKPRNGYRINVYVVYLKNNAEYDRKKLDTVTYPATGTVVLYYPGDTPPPEGMTTPLPSSTPSSTSGQQSSQESRGPTLPPDAPVG